jgi:hypothetical protein
MTSSTKIIAGSDPLRVPITNDIDTNHRCIGRLVRYMA